MRGLHVPETGGEGLQPTRRNRLGRRQGQGIGGGRRPHGGQIGQIDAQRLDRQAFRVGIGQEMLACDQGVGGHDQLAAGGRRQQSGVVLEVERFGPAPGQGPEIGGDQIEFAQIVRCVVAHAVRHPSAIIHRVPRILGVNCGDLK